MSKRRFKDKVVSKKHVARKEREDKQSAIIRNFAIGIVAVVILLVGYGYLDQTLIQNQREVAIVNDEKITISQFQARVRLERENLINQYIQYAQLAQSIGMDVAAQVQPIEARLNQPLQIGQNVLDTMINELLYRQEAANHGITVSAEDIEKELQAFLDYFPDGTPTPAPTATQFVVENATLSPEQLKLVTLTPTPTEAPTSTPGPDPTATPTEEAEPTEEAAAPTPVPVPTLTATPYTFDGYQQTYQDTLPLYTEFGLTEEDFRFLFESRLYYVKLYDKVTADISHEGEYIWARHILLEESTLANIVREQLLAGEDFGLLAAEASIDPSAATNNGDLGWFTTGMMVEPFGATAFALEIGEISEVVQTDFGYHVIQLLGRENRPLDQNTLRQARDLAFQEWLAELREKSNIETLDIWLENVPTEPDLQQTLAELYGGQQ